MQALLLHQAAFSKPPHASRPSGFLTLLAQNAAVSNKMRGKSNSKRSLMISSHRAAPLQQHWGTTRGATHGGAARCAVSWLPPPPPHPGLP